MSRYKYNEGDQLGPWNIIFLKRLDEQDSAKRKPFGLFQCPECGAPVKTRIRNVVKGSFHYCPQCRSKKRSEKMINNDYGTYNGQNLINKTFGSWIVIEKLEERQNGHVLWLCECTCGTKQKISTGNLIQGISTQCMSCSLKSNQSKGAKLIENILQENNIKYDMEYSFDNCSYKNKLRFDFYLPDYNTCIEYDGEQHYKEKNYWRDNLKTIQLRDNIKNKYCKEHNINLIRIPYWDLKKISSEYLFSLLKGGDLERC